MATSGSMTMVETTDEVPKPPKTYKLILKMSWKKFKDFFQSKEILDSQQKLKKERKAILYKIDKGEQISEAERETLNSSFKQTLLLLFQNLQMFLLSYLELEESDSPQLQSFKLLAANDVVLWLKNLDHHISKILDDILDSSLPEREMIAKTKKVLDDLKNEIKPNNFSEFSATAANLGVSVDDQNPTDKSAELDSESAELDSESAKLDSESAELDSESAKLDSKSAGELDGENAKLESESHVAELDRNKHSDEEEGFWEYIFGEWFIL